MLEAGDRRLLFDALRPPDGYVFDQGIGTTYTLDLLALLMAPLAFTFFDQSRREEGAAYDSLEVLESLRRYADRLTLFCQAGRTTIPTAQYPQLAFIEESIVECQPVNGGAFHPKLWVLRFTGDGPVKYRVLCLSRNLVFAQCWDTMLTLDGDLEDRSRAISASRPLAEFVEALPHHAVRKPLLPDVSNRIQTIASEVMRTRFVPPAEFEEFTFWPIGMPGRRSAWPFEALGKRRVIVSPFLTLSRIEELAEGASETTVISTAGALGALDRRPENVQRFYVLNERAQAEVAETAHGTKASVAEMVQMLDLHAKLYVTEIGSRAHIWTGSANATASGFDRNVEFVVQLVGPRKKFGIDSLLQPERDAVRLINLLTPADDLVARVKPSDDEKELERRLDAVRSQLAAAKLEARVERSGESFAIGIWCPDDVRIEIPPGIEARCCPSSIAPQAAATIESGPGGRRLAAFTSLTKQALTPFIAFEISGRQGTVEMTVAFALNLPLIGAPEDRKDEVLRTLLQDRRKLLRFVMLLLASEGMAVPDFVDGDGSTSSSSSRRRDAFSPNGLFEMLLRALDEAPHRLDHLESLLAQLRRGRADVPLPDGFDAVWEPILAHRRSMAVTK